MSKKKKSKSAPKLTAGARSGDEQTRVLGPDSREGETPHHDDPDPLTISWQKDDKNPNLLGLFVEAAVKPKLLKRRLELRKLELDAEDVAATARQQQRAEELRRAEHERALAKLRAPVKPPSKPTAEPPAAASGTEEVESPSVPVAEAAESPAPSVVEEEFIHDDDYRTILWKGQDYSLTPGQAKVVRLLHGRYLRGLSGVSKDLLLEALETDNRFPGRLQDLFPRHDPNHVLWGTLIVPVPRRRGIYTLNLKQQPSLSARK
jgi:hypothetical protein